MRILFITTIPSPYRVSFFNELGKISDLTVLFEKSASDERDVSWKDYSFDYFKGIIMRGIKINTNSVLCPSVTKFFKIKWDVIIISNISTPTGMYVIQHLKFHNIMYWIEGDGGYAKSGKGLKELIKKHFISGAKGYFSTSDEHDKYYITYGAQKEKIFRYPFTSVGSGDIVQSVFNRKEKLELRNSLGIKEKNIIVSVGQFIYRKGFDVLIKSSYYLSEDYGIYIIGGKPTSEYLQLVNRTNNIHFEDFKETAVLRKYLLASDLFVLPTREDIWGLVINEAMSCGLPVITTDRCIAGQELISNGENGYIVPSDSPKLLADAILKCFENDVSRFGEKSLNIIKDYTFEKMAQRHIDVLNANI